MPTCENDEYYGISAECSKHAMRHDESQDEHMKNYEN